MVHGPLQSFLFAPAPPEARASARPQFLFWEDVSRRTDLVSKGQMMKWAGAVVSIHFLAIVGSEPCDVSEIALLQKRSPRNRSQSSLQEDLLQNALQQEETGWTCFRCRTEFTLYIYVCCMYTYTYILKPCEALCPICNPSWKGGAEGDRSRAAGRGPPALRAPGHRGAPPWVVPFFTLFV